MLRRLLAWTAFLILVAAGGYGVLWYERPCGRPLLYSIAAVDLRFPVSQEQFDQAVITAIGWWETAAGKQLFARTATGGLMVHAVYDHRQEASEQLRTLGIQLDQGQESYDAVHDRYLALKKDYDDKEALYQEQRTIFDHRKSVYEAQVTEYQQQGGAPPAEVTRLAKERDAINAMVDGINTQRDELQKSVDQLNAVVSVLQRMATDQNGAVKTFESIGSTLPKEYEAGLYTRNAQGTAVTVFVIDDSQQLTRLLAHELGHAIGLEHSEDPKAIMYRLNESQNKELTASDISALKMRCGL